MNAAALSPIFRELTNHLWQSTIFLFAAVLLTLAFRKNRAQVRYWIWLSASLKFLVPFALLMSLGSTAWNDLAARKMAASIATPAVSLTVAQIAQPFSETQTFGGAASATTHGTNWLIVGIAVWACGFFALTLMRLRGWLRVRAALRTSKPIDIASQQVIDRHSESRFEGRRTPLEISLRTTPGLLEPGVVGIFRQTLLLPEGILQNLTPPQLESVLAHELAHIRRRDNFTAAIHMLVEAIFWFHPAVWWIGARLVEERERACDESVLSRGNAPRDYAEAILGVCKLYVESPLVCVSGVTGADLKKRIHEILSGHVSDELRLVKKVALAIAAVLALALPIFMGAITAPAMHAQSTAGSLPSFEVASIKPDPVAADYQGTHIHMGLVGSHYISTGLTAKYLIEVSYGVEDFQVSGGPDWINSDKYNIDAKIDDATFAAWQKLSADQRTDDLFMQMFQSLLAERFKLKISHQTKDLPMYALVVAKGGPKFSSSQETFPNAGHGAPEADLLKSAGSHVFSDNGGPITAVENGVSMKTFVSMLARRPELGGRLVLDQTGLNDKYTFKFQWVRQPTGGADDNNSSVAVTGPSLWTALEEQLGLRLESAKGPVDTIVIDSIEKPSEN